MELYQFQNVRLEPTYGDPILGRVFQKPLGQQAVVIQYGTRHFIIHSKESNDVMVYKECYATSLVREES